MRRPLWGPLADVVLRLATRSARCPPHPYRLALGVPDNCRKENVTLSVNGVTRASRDPRHSSVMEQTKRFVRRDTGLATECVERD